MTMIHGTCAFTYWKEGYWLLFGVCNKFNSDGFVARLKVRLVAKGYAQT